MKYKRIATLLCALHIFVCGFTENFRVHKTVIKSLPLKSGSVHADLEVNDALVLQISETGPLLQGVELEIKIPPIVAEYGNAIAYALYDDITPQPEAGRIDYSGKRLSINTFPESLSCNIKIPLIKKHTIKSDPYTVLMPALFSAPVKTLFFRLQLVMKGAPAELADAVFSVNIKPVLMNRGWLDLRVLYPAERNGSQKEAKEVLLFIDEKKVDFTQTPLLLEAGMHRLSLVSEHYRNEVRSFSIEQAKTSVVEIQLQDIVPLLYLSAPKNTRFFIDNTEIKDYSKPVIMEPGSRQLRFSIGDYESVRVLEAEKGRSYKVSVSFDVTIAEQ